MLYYSDGGPGPATKLLRLDVRPDGDRTDWHTATSWEWGLGVGWIPEPLAQAMILATGDFGLVDESQVSEVQQQIRERYEQFH